MKDEFILNLAIIVLIILGLREAPFWGRCLIAALGIFFVMSLEKERETRKQGGLKEWQEKKRQEFEQKGKESTRQRQSEHTRGDTRN